MEKFFEEMGDFVIIMMMFLPIIIGLVKIIEQLM